MNMELALQTHARKHRYCTISRESSFLFIRIGCVMVPNKNDLKLIPKAISNAEIRSKALGYQDCIIVSHQPIPFYVFTYLQMADWKCHNAGLVDVISVCRTLIDAFRPSYYEKSLSEICYEQWWRIPRLRYVCFFVVRDAISLYC